MEKISITIRQETLHNLVTQLKRDNALAVLKTIASAIKNGEWNVEIVCANGDTENIKTAGKFVEYLKKRYSTQARNEGIKKLTALKRVKGK